MMQWAQELLKKVEATRSVRLEQPAPVLDSVQEGALLKQYHPDYLGHERKLAVGPNAGEEKFPLELAELLEGDSSLEPDTTPKVDIETDVLILGSRIFLVSTIIFHSSSVLPSSMKSPICGMTLKAICLENLVGSGAWLTKIPLVWVNNSSMASLPAPDTAW